MDTAQWPQEIVVKPIEEILVTNSSSTCPKPPPAGAERKAATRPQKDQLALNCPRCNSTNTKFCYYNNYSLTQPRYFCKTCRRYWTEGGSLRNIPVGGGSRKNKRSSSSSTTTTSSSSISASSSAQAAARNNNINKLPDLVNPHHHHHQNPKIHHHEDHQGQDLNLAFPTGQQGFRSNISEFVQAPNIENNKNNSNHISSLELLTGMSSRGLNSFMPMPPVHHHHHHHHNPDPTSNNNTVNYTPGLFPSMQDFKPTLSFSLDGLGSGYGSLQETTNGRLLFPFEDLKQVSSTTQHDIHDHQQNRDQQHNGDSSGYWTGMLGGGSW